jgi:hypothetical protein
LRNGNLQLITRIQTGTTRKSDWWWFTEGDYTAGRNIPTPAMRLHTSVRETFPACLIVALLAACSSTKPAEPSSSSPQNPPKAAEARQPQYETGREAFQKMYLAARLWVPDIKPFRLQSQYSPDAPSSEGKAGLWRCSFASASKRAMKMFIWSGLVGPDAPEPGVSFTAEDSWSPTNNSTQVFDLAFLKVDSDQAFQVAQQHGGEKLLKKNPKQPVFFSLDWDSRKGTLLWHVVYGTSMDEAGLRVAVNATSGQFERVEK